MNYQRIAFVTLMSGQSWGGSEALWSKTAMLALNEGHQVFVSVYQWDHIPSRVLDLKRMGAIVHFRERFSHDLPLMKKILRFIKNRLPALQDVWSDLFLFQPDVIFVNQGDSFDLAVHHLSLFNEIKKRGIRMSIICHNHSPFCDIPQSNVYPSARDMMNYADPVYVVSRRMGSIIQRQLCLEIQHIQMTWNPLNLNSYDYITYPEIRAVRWAIVGNLGTPKGHDTLFEVLSDPIWRDREWQLNIYGAGYGKQYLIDLATYFGIDDKVVFCGHVSSATEIWKNNHLLLIPSSGEGLPISLCEAMICGRSAVVTDVGGNAEMIEEGITGFVAEAPSVYSFAKALNRAWEQKEIWQEMGMKARESAMERIDLKPEVSLLTKLLAKT